MINALALEKIIENKKIFWQKKNIFILLCQFFVTALPVDAETSYRATDYAGQNIVLQKPAVRIIAMAPHIVENIFSAGAGDRVVGVVDYSDYPEAAKTITRIGAAHGFSLEAIIALQPDLIIVWGSGYSAERFAKLKALGIPIYVDEPKKLEDIAKSIHDIGALTGLSEQAKAVVEDYKIKLSGLRQVYAKRTTIDVFYQVWNNPLQTINSNSIISDVITLCGANNIFADAAVIAPRVSIESVLERNPDVIVAGNAEGSLWFERWYQWPAIKAVKNKHLFAVSPDLMQRHTVRLLQGAQELCQFLDGVRLQTKN